MPSWGFYRDFRPFDVKAEVPANLDFAVQITTGTRHDRQIPLPAVPAETRLATGNRYQLTTNLADERMRHAAQFGNRSVAPGWQFPQGNLNGSVLVLVGSAQPVLVVGRQGEFERVKPGTLPNLGLDAPELRQFAGQKPVKTVR